MNFDYKKIYGGLSFLLFLLLPLCIGCDKEDSKERIVVMNISSDLVWMGARPPGSPTDSVQLMECRVEGTDEILYLSKGIIEGFEYVEGFQYKVRVKIIELDNPPADGYTEKYELLEVISREEKSS